MYKIVQAADCISEEKTVETAQKAMETDLGAKAKELKLCINETYTIQGVDNIVYYKH